MGTQKDDNNNKKHGSNAACWQCAQFVIKINASRAQRVLLFLLELEHILIVGWPTKEAQIVIQTSKQIDEQQTSEQAIQMGTRHLKQVFGDGNKKRKSCWFNRQEVQLSKLESDSFVGQFGTWRTLTLSEE